MPDAAPLHRRSSPDSLSGASVRAERGQSPQLTLPAVELAIANRNHVPERTRRVFCNRNLRLDQVDWVGFDMDYTLAVYDQPKMDQLTIWAALPKLIARGYPVAEMEGGFATWEANGYPIAVPQSRAA